MHGLKSFFVEGELIWSSIDILQRRICGQVVEDVAMSFLMESEPTRHCRIGKTYHVQLHLINNVLSKCLDP